MAICGRREAHDEEVPAQAALPAAALSASTSRCAGPHKKAGVDEACGHAEGSFDVQAVAVIFVPLEAESVPQLGPSLPRRMGSSTQIAAL